MVYKDKARARKKRGFHAFKRLVYGESSSHSQLPQVSAGLNMYEVGVDKVDDDCDVRDVKIYGAIDRASLNLSRRRDSETDDEVVIDKNAIEQQVFKSIE
jgi:hypothetical protein